MDRGAWWAAVHGVAKSRPQLSDFTFTFHFHALEKEMATHSSVLAWRIPGSFPCGSAGKESAFSAGDLGSIPGEGKGYPLQYSGLEYFMDCKVLGVAKSWTRLSHFYFLLIK